MSIKCYNECKFNIFIDISSPSTPNRLNNSSNNDFFHSPTATFNDTDSDYSPAGPITMSQRENIFGICWGNPSTSSSTPKRRDLPKKRPSLLKKTKSFSHPKKIFTEYSMPTPLPTNKGLVLFLEIFLNNDK